VVGAASRLTDRRGLSTMESSKCMMTSALLDITDTQYVSALSVVEHIEHARLLPGFPPPP